MSPRRSGRTVVVIPARFASERLPGKPLVEIAGKPMIQHVVERASKAQSADAVVVATDDKRIASAVEACGGTAVILLIGTLVLGVSDLAEIITSQGWEGVVAALGHLLRVPDFWLWLYLIFAISNAMLPSESDMATIRPVLIFLGIVAAVVLVVGGVPTIPPEVVQAVNAIAGYLATAFALTLAVDLVFMLGIGLLLWLTRWIQGG